MIKIDYEGAWKELKGKYDDTNTPYYPNKCLRSEWYIWDGVRWALQQEIVNLKNAMTDIEKHHTHDIIELKKRNDKEIVDYCIKKYAEVYLENIYLKKKLREKKEKDKIFNVHMECVEMGKSF